VTLVYNNRTSYYLLGPHEIAIQNKLLVPEAWKGLSSFGCVTKLGRSRDDLQDQTGQDC